MTLIWSMCRIQLSVNTSRKYAAFHEGRGGGDSFLLCSSASISQHFWFESWSLFLSFDGGVMLEFGGNGSGNEPKQ